MVCVNTQHKSVRKTVHNRRVYSSQNVEMCEKSTNAENESKV